MTFWTICTCGHDRTTHAHTPEGSPCGTRYYGGACAVPGCPCHAFTLAPGQTFPWQQGGGKLPEGMTAEQALGLKESS